MLTRTLPFLVALLLSSLAHAVTVRVVLKVPADTPTVDNVYLAGSLASTGGWKADGLRLYRDPQNPTTTFTGEFEADAGQTLEFKFTRGTWATVEKNADGSDRPNRTFSISDGATVIEAAVARWGEGSASPSSVVGRLSMDLLWSPTLKGSRMLRVWLPPDYYKDPQRTFPLLVMHDGQNCFDAATSTIGQEWRIDEALTDLIKRGDVPPMVVVAIDHGGDQRVNEYTFDAHQGRGGAGATYAGFLLDEALPFIRRNYRVSPGPRHTFIGGSSLGALSSLEIARRNPGVFGGVIAMSPAVWWNDRALVRALEQDAGGLKPARVWVDVGTKEQSPGAAAETYVTTARSLEAALKKHSVECRLTVEDGAEHNERAWAGRFPDAIRFLVHGR